MGLINPMVRPLLVGTVVTDGWGRDYFLAGWEDCLYC
jgi:hypothetical protein